MTFILKIKTAAERAEEASELGRAAAKAECARRINAVADIVTQTNLLAASQTGQLSEAEQATFLAGHQWIRAMQAAWPVLVETGVDIHDDANWPTVPAGAVELAEAY